MTKTNRSSNSTGPKRASSLPPSEAFELWFERTWTTALQDLSFSELRRSLQALSRRYVQDRESLEGGAPLETAGKRAAFAAFYSPLHLLLVASVVRALDLTSPLATRRIVDLGCGTGASAAGWIEALLGTAQGAPALPAIEGFDRNPWALGEARRTWSAFGVRGTTRKASIVQTRLPSGPDTTLLAAWTINELAPSDIDGMLKTFRRVAAAGGRVLVIEPISRQAAPWWPRWADAVEEDGGRVDEWRIQPKLPPRWWDLDKAAKLDHRQVKLRTLCWPAARPPGPA